MYKDLLNEKKRRLMKFLTRTFGAGLLISLIFTLYLWATKGDFLEWQGLITFGLFIAWLFLATWISNSQDAQRLQRYVEETPSNDPVSFLVKSYLNSDLKERFKNAGFLDISHGPIFYTRGIYNFAFFVSVGKKQFMLVFVENRWKWFVGDSNIEEQDIEDDQWTSIDFSEYNVNSIDDVILIIKRLCDL
jgi:hypothetical protein